MYVFTDTYHSRSKKFKQKQFLECESPVGEISQIINLIMSINVTNIKKYWNVCLKAEVSYHQIDTLKSKLISLQYRSK